MMVPNLGFRVKGLGCRVKVKGLGFRVTVTGLGFRVALETETGIL